MLHLTLKNLNIEFKIGETTAIVGKPDRESTLVNILLGLIKQTHGDYLLTLNLLMILELLN